MAQLCGTFGCQKFDGHAGLCEIVLVHSRSERKRGRSDSWRTAPEELAMAERKAKAQAKAKAGGGGTPSSSAGGGGGGVDGTDAAAMGGGSGGAEGGAVERAARGGAGAGTMGAFEVDPAWSASGWGQYYPPSVCVVPPPPPPSFRPYKPPPPTAATAAADSSSGAAAAGSASAVPSPRTATGEGGAGAPDPATWRPPPVGGAIVVEVALPDGRTQWKSAEVRSHVSPPAAAPNGGGGKRKQPGGGAASGGSGSQPRGSQPRGSQPPLSFVACVDGDEDFLETFTYRDEGREWRRVMPRRGEIIEVEVDDDGEVEWRRAEVVKRLFAAGTVSAPRADPATLTPLRLPRCAYPAALTPPLLPCTGTHVFSPRSLSHSLSPLLSLAALPPCSPSLLSFSLPARHADSSRRSSASRTARRTSTLSRPSSLRRRAASGGGGAPAKPRPARCCLGGRVCAVCGKCTYDTRRSFVTMVGCSPQAFGRWFDREMGGAVVTIWTAMDMEVCDGWVGRGGHRCDLRCVEHSSACFCSTPRVDDLLCPGASCRSRMKSIPRSPYPVVRTPYMADDDGEKVVQYTWRHTR